MSINEGKLSEKEQKLVNECKILMPERFRATATDDRILQFIEIVIADINVIPPLSTYNAQSLPDVIRPIVRFGVSMYAEIFQQMRATLDDFTWSDQGVTVAIDQTAKINISLTNMTRIYERMITNYKKTQIFNAGASLGTPRFNTALGQFLKIALGTSFLWNSP